MLINMYEWIHTQIHSKKKKPMPILSFPGIQLLQISVKDLVSNSDLQANCMKAIADRYPTAASLSNMDLSIEAEAFGAEVRFSDDEVPTVVGRLVDSFEDAVTLRVPEVGTKRTGVAINAIHKAVNLITDRPVFAGVIGPYSLAARLMEMTEIMVKCMLDPDTVHTVLKKATQFLTEYIRTLKKAGANGIIMAEPAAGLLSPELCSSFSSYYIKEIMDSVQDENFIVIYHNCGNTAPLAEAIIATTARVIHLGNAIKLTEVIDKYPPNKLIMGNLDPAGEFRNGTPDSISKATFNLLSELSHRPNWIISSGCDIPPLSPLANIDSFFKTITDYYDI